MGRLAVDDHHHNVNDEITNTVIITMISTNTMNIIKKMTMLKMMTTMIDAKMNL